MGTEFREQCGDEAPESEQTKRIFCRRRSIVAFVLFGLSLLSWVFIVLVTMWFMAEMGSVSHGFIAIFGVFYWGFILWLIAGFLTITATVGGVFAFKALRLAGRRGLRIALIVAFVLQVISALLAAALFAYLCRVFIPLL